MAADPWLTPNRRPQLRPDTVPQELDFDTQAVMATLF
jgi:hypothetical protein